MKIQKLRDAAGSKYVKLVIWGKAGVGKTRFACQAPIGETLIISGEKGLLSVKDSGGDHDVVEVTTVDEVREALDFLEAYSGHNYAWVVLDSISEIVENMLAQAKFETKDPRQAYGAVGDGAPEMMKRFRDLEMNVIFTAKSEPVKNAEGDITGHQPSGGWARISEKIPYLFDEILHLEAAKAAKKSFRLRCHPSRGLEIKDRSGKLDEFEEPNLQAIFEKIAQ